ncbi:SDR family oxidoreductase [Paenibacillus aquistagni]|uniref:SDR family oxidoreductase n=1 Tax=Paenibacillus aquistagni TaxID=1852522 RepID=UPI00145B8539|nr:SDR family oxidoreductase [Paenibacillus aquistagni]
MIAISSPKVVWITGASSGFGKLAAQVFARNGDTVIAALRQKDARQAALLASIEAPHRDHVFVYELDVREEQQIQGAVNQVIKEHGRIDVLINNAGYAVGGFVEDLDIETWREQFDTNVFGLIQMCKAVIPYMREARAGCIIQMSSISGRMAFPALGPYVSSKFAVEGFSETLRLELLPYGVDVVLVEPGSYRTKIWARGITSASQDDTPNARFVSRIMEQVKKTGEQAQDPREVVDLLLRIAHLPNGSRRLRYPIGNRVSLNLAARALLPWRIFERMVWKVIGIRINRK